MLSFSRKRIPSSPTSNSLKAPSAKPNAPSTKPHQRNPISTSRQSSSSSLTQPQSQLSFLLFSKILVDHEFPEQRRNLKRSQKNNSNSNNNNNNNNNENDRSPATSVILSSAFNRDRKDFFASAIPKHWLMFSALIVDRLFPVSSPAPTLFFASALLPSRLQYQSLQKKKEFTKQLFLTKFTNPETFQDLFQVSKKVVLSHKGENEASVEEFLPLDIIDGDAEKLKKKREGEHDAESFTEFLSTLIPTAPKPKTSDDDVDSDGSFFTKSMRSSTPIDEYFKVAPPKFWKERILYELKNISAGGSSTKRRSSSDYLRKNKRKIRRPNEEPMFNFLEGEGGDEDVRLEDEGGGEYDRTDQEEYSRFAAISTLQKIFIDILSSPLWEGQGNKNFELAHFATIDCLAATTRYYGFHYHPDNYNNNNHSNNINNNNNNNNNNNTVDRTNWRQSNIQNVPIGESPISTSFARKARHLYENIGRPDLFISLMELAAILCFRDVHDGFLRMMVDEQRQHEQHQQHHQSGLSSFFLIVQSSDDVKNISVVSSRLMNLHPDIMPYLVTCASKRTVVVAAAAAAAAASGNEGENKELPADSPLSSSSSSSLLSSSLERFSWSKRGLVLALSLMSHRRLMEEKQQQQKQHHQNPQSTIDPRNKQHQQHQPAAYHVSTNCALVVTKEWDRCLKCICNAAVFTGRDDDSNTRNWIEEARKTMMLQKMDASANRNITADTKLSLLGSEIVSHHQEEVIAKRNENNDNNNNNNYNNNNNNHNINSSSPIPPASHVYYPTFSDEDQLSYSCFSVRFVDIVDTVLSVWKTANSSPTMSTSSSSVSSASSTSSPFSTTAPSVSLISNVNHSSLVSVVQHFGDSLETRLKVIGFHASAVNHSLPLSVKMMLMISTKSTSAKNSEFSLNRSSTGIEMLLSVLFSPYYLNFTSPASAQLPTTATSTGSLLMQFLVRQLDAAIETSKYPLDSIRNILEAFAEYLLTLLSSSLSSSYTRHCDDKKKAAVITMLLGNQTVFERIHRGVRSNFSGGDRGGGTGEKVVNSNKVAITTVTGETLIVSKPYFKSDRHQEGRRTSSGNNNDGSSTAATTKQKVISKHHPMTILLVKKFGFVKLMSSPSSLAPGKSEILQSDDSSTSKKVLASMLLRAYDEIFGNEQLNWICCSCQSKVYWPARHCLNCSLLTTALASASSSSSSSFSFTCPTCKQQDHILSDDYDDQHRHHHHHHQNSIDNDSTRRCSSCLSLHPSAEAFIQYNLKKKLNPAKSDVVAVGRPKPASGACLDLWECTTCCPSGGQLCYKHEPCHRCAVSWPPVYSSNSKSASPPSSATSDPDELVACHSCGKLNRSDEDIVCRDGCGSVRLQSKLMQQLQLRASSASDGDNDDNGNFLFSCQQHGQRESSSRQKNRLPLPLLLWSCPGCSKFKIITSNTKQKETCCASCGYRGKLFDESEQQRQQAELDSKPRIVLPYSQWICGCGSLNSPTHYNCVSCSCSSSSSSTSSSKNCYCCPGCKKVVEPSSLSSSASASTSLQSSSSSPPTLRKCPHCQSTHPVDVLRVRKPVWTLCSECDAILPSSSLPESSGTNFFSSPTTKKVDGGDEEDGSGIGDAGEVDDDDGNLRCGKCAERRRRARQNDRTFAHERRVGPSVVSHSSLLLSSSPSSSSRLRVSFSAAPWSCHKCGTVNEVFAVIAHQQQQQQQRQRQTKLPTLEIASASNSSPSLPPAQPSSASLQIGPSGALLCKSCGADRLPVSLFSETAEWYCGHHQEQQQTDLTGSESPNTGFACSTCFSLHPHVPSTSVFSWVCENCSNSSSSSSNYNNNNKNNKNSKNNSIATLNPSWLRHCRKCGSDKRKCVASNPKDVGERNENGQQQVIQLKYLPWHLASSRDRPGDGSKNVSVKPTPPPLCPLCNENHATLKCSPANESKRLDALEEQLLSCGGEQDESWSSSDVTEKASDEEAMNVPVLGMREMTPLFSKQENNRGASAQQQLQEEKNLFEVAQRKQSEADEERFKSLLESSLSGGLF